MAEFLRHFLAVVFDVVALASLTNPVCVCVFVERGVASVYHIYLCVFLESC